MIARLDWQVPVNSVAARRIDRLASPIPPDLVWQNSYVIDVGAVIGHSFPRDHEGGYNVVRLFAVTVVVAGSLSTMPVHAEELLAGADIGYGEYLSGECVTCHSQDGADRGIPSITGLDPETFATVMHAYKVGDIEHPVMKMVTSRLDAEQIASLAVFFASLPAAE
jgi:cytochrome c553